MSENVKKLLRFPKKKYKAARKHKNLGSRTFFVVHRGVVGADCIHPGDGVLQLNYNNSSLIGGIQPTGRDIVHSVERRNVLSLFVGFRVLNTIFFRDICITGGIKQFIRDFTALTERRNYLVRQRNEPLRESNEPLQGSS